ncbi:MAG: phage integrase family protein [Holophagaceae bacterium]|nr:phage integrase family protein [Holophagaceae bacterium]
MPKKSPVATSVLPAEAEDTKGLCVENIKSMAVGEVLWDESIKGLHCRCFEGRKSFYLYYRTKTGRQRKPKLGDQGSITLTQARDAAKKLLGEVAGGADPVGAWTEAKSEPTLLDLWNEWWKRHGSGKKSADEDLRQWRYFLGGFPKEDKRAAHKPQLAAWTRKRLSELDYQAMDDLHKSIKAKTAANRLLALLSAMLSFAEGPLGWIERNPCLKVKRNPEKKRRRYATPVEVARIAATLAKHEALKTSNQSAVAFIKLLILTGARLSEIGSARWDQIKGNRIVLPPEQHKTGGKDGEDRIIQLNPEAMAVIKSLPRTTGTICGIQSPAKMWQVIRVEAKCADIRLHDLRHSFASVALAEGLELAQIGQLLGHRSVASTQRYAHLLEEAAQRGVNTVGRRIGRMMGERDSK